MSEEPLAPSTPAPVAAPVSPESASPKPSGTPDYRALASAYLEQQASAPAEVPAGEPEAVVDDRPRDELGRFAPKEAAAVAPEGENAAASQPEANVEAVEGGEQPDAVTPEPQPEPIKVSVRGRDGSDVEIEVTDPAVADLLRANHNDGMRREEFNRQMATVTQYLAEKREFETLLETNPEHVILNHLPEEKRIAIATTLLAQYWDQIVPSIQQFNDNPVSRVQQAAQAQIAIRDQQTEFQRRTQAAKVAAEVETATRALIPESADEATTEQFLNDALMDLKRAASQGTPILPQSIPSLLAHRIRLYGFEPQADSSRASVPPSVPAKKPAIAAKAVTPAPTVDEAKAKQQAIKDQQAKIAAARAQAPAGAGAAPLKIPAVPKGLTVEQASAYVRKHMPAYTS